MKKIYIDKYSPKEEVFAAFRDNKKYHQKCILKNCNVDYLNDDQIIIEALKNDLKNFRYLGETNKNDAKLILKSLEQVKKFANIHQEKNLYDEKNIKYLYQQFNPKLANDNKIASFILKINQDYFKFLPDKFKVNIRFVKNFLKDNYLSLEHMDSKLQNNYEIYQSAISQWKLLSSIEKGKTVHPFCFLNSDKKKNTDYIKNFLIDMDIDSYNYKQYEDIKDCLNKILEERAIIEEVVSKNGYIMQYLDDKSKCDRELVIKAVSSYPAAFFCVSRKFYDDREVIMLALNDTKNTCFHNPLKKVPSKYYKDRELMKIAVKYFVDTLLYADTSIRNDDEIISIALNHYHYLWSTRPNQEWDELYDTLEYAQEIHPLQVVGEEYLKDKFRAFLLIQSEQTSFVFLSQTLRNDRDLILYLLKSTTAMWTHKSYINHIDKIETHENDNVLVEFSRPGLLRILDNYTDFDFRNDKECVMQILNCNFPLDEDYTLEEFGENNFYIGKNLVGDEDVLKAAVHFADKHHNDNYGLLYELFNHDYFGEHIKKIRYFENKLKPFENRVRECFHDLSYDYLAFENYGKNYAQAIDHLKEDYFYNDYEFDSASFLFYTEERNIWRKDPEQLIVYYQFNSQDKGYFIDNFKEFALHPEIQEGLPPRIKFSAKRDENESDKCDLNLGPYVHGSEYDVSQEKTDFNKKFGSDTCPQMKVINSAIAGAEKTQNNTETKDDESKFGFWQWVWVFIVAKWLIIGAVNLISN